MDSNIQENVVLYDWLSFTSKIHTPEQIIDALGLSHCPWTETKGARGYQDRLYFGAISIHYNGREDTLACVGNLKKSMAEGDMMTEEEIIALQCNQPTNMDGVEKPSKRWMRSRKQKRK